MFGGYAEATNCLGLIYLVSFPRAQCKYTQYRTGRSTDPQI